MISGLTRKGGYWKNIHDDVDHKRTIRNRDLAGKQRKSAEFEKSRERDRRDL